MTLRQWGFAGIALGLWGGLTAWRLNRELGEGAVRGGYGIFSVGSRYDPRGKERVRRLSDRRESDAFRERLRSKDQQGMPWPGLRALDVTMSALEVLQGLHTDTSYEGDFSWLFSKLDRIMRFGAPNASEFVGRVSPFFYVMGRDPAGATYILNTLVDQESSRWFTWFWAGFHAHDNLFQKTLAADLYRRASELPGALALAEQLSRRLARGDEAWASEAERAQVLDEQLSPELKDVLRKER